MKAVIQRVSEASVTVEGKKFSQISKGLLVLVGIEDADNAEDISWLASKICDMRIFDDGSGVMNKSVLDIDGSILVVSQFTLQASTKKGNRPSYIKASKSEIAIPIYDSFIQEVAHILGKQVATGSFGANMEVFLINSGPVTITVDTKNRF